MTKWVGTKADRHNNLCSELVGKKYLLVVKIYMFPVKSALSTFLFMVLFLMVWT